MKRRFTAALLVALTAPFALAADVPAQTPPATAVTIDDPAALITQLRARDLSQRLDAIERLGVLAVNGTQVSTIMPALIGLTRSPEDVIREATVRHVTAIAVAHRSQAAAGIRALDAQNADRSADIRMQAVAGLAAIAIVHPNVVSQALNAIDGALSRAANSTGPLRPAAMGHIAAIGAAHNNTHAITTIRNLSFNLRDRDHNVRRAAAEGIVVIAAHHRTQYNAALNYLATVTGDSHPAVAAAAQAGIAQLRAQYETPAPAP